jgi:hypothetical protein
MGRVIFERSKGIASRRKRLGRVGFSIAVAAGCHVPLGMKLRVIGRRAASLGISPGRVVAIRSAAIATWQGVRNYFSVGRVGRETGAQGFTSR